MAKWIAGVVVAGMFLAGIARAQPASAPTTAFSLPPVTTDENSLASHDTVLVRQFRFEGNTAIPSAELTQVAEQIASQVPDRKLSLDQLEEIRQALTQRYVDRGYTTSGALLPDQDIADGTVTYKIVEGWLAEIHFDGGDDQNKSEFLRLRRSYLQQNLQLGSNRPLNIFTLRNRLEQLRNDANLERLNAELKPGDEPGKSVLDLRYRESPPVTAALSFNNHHPPSSGAERFEALVGVRNIVGVNDQLSIDYDITEGGFEQMKWAGLDAFQINYALPIHPSGTSLIFDVERSNDSVVEEPFAELGIASDSWSYSVTLRQPIYHSATAEAAVFFTGAYRTNRSTLLGEEFDFSPGSVDGKSKISVMRIGQEFTKSSATNALSLRSTFSIGVNWFNATDNGGDIADSQFFAWLGQFQFVHKLGQSNNRLLFRAAGQLTGDRLPSLEQFTIGGYETVRGYRENRLVRDNGFATSLELHVPIGASPTPILELVPFLDAGFGRDNHEVDADRHFISSAGVGVIFKPNEHLTASIFYGYPFEQFPDHDNIQDNGISFDITLGTSF